MSDATLAAGAAIWRPAADAAEDAEILLVHRPAYDDWSLPKGKRDRKSTRLNSSHRP